MRQFIAGTLAGAALFAAIPAGAQDMVSAADPSGMAKTLRDAGYKAELKVDAVSDPLIATTFGEYQGSFYFYGCNETSHDKCDSVQLRVGLDRKTATPTELVNEIVRKYRYGAMFLDDDGDPWINFDIVTGDGIPKPVFMTAVNAYVGNLEQVADMIFAEERAE